MAGFQAALLTWVLIVVPTVASFTSTMASAVNDGVSWLDSTRQGTEFFLAAHGGTFAIGQGRDALGVTVTPLGITLLGLLLCRLLGRLAHTDGWWLLGFGTLGYAATTAILAYGLGTATAHASAPSAISGSVMVAACGMAWANGLRGLTTKESRLHHLPPWAKALPRAATTTAAALLGAATLCALIWAIAGAPRFAATFSDLSPDPVGAVALLGTCLAFAPNLVAWAVAYLSGVGFAFGDQHLTTPLHAELAPLPDFPLLALLPTTPPRPILALLIAVPVLIGGLIGWWLVRRSTHERHWWTMAALALSTSLLASAALTGFVALSSGSIGQGQLAHVGARAVPVGMMLLVEFGISAVAVAVIGRVAVSDRLWKVAHSDKPIAVKGRSIRWWTPKEEPPPRTVAAQE